ncbi:MAG: hypothetical protein AVDCRST_MAG89-4305, partial [uncultured Gemmatimonadetes bacterium]
AHRDFRGHVADGAGGDLRGGRRASLRHHGHVRAGDAAVPAVAARAGDGERRLPAGGRRGAVRAQAAPRGGMGAGAAAGGRVARQPADVRRRAGPGRLRVGGDAAPAAPSAAARAHLVGVESGGAGTAL